jgi:hypothetical protein
MFRSTAIAAVSLFGLLALVTLIESGIAAL